MTSRCLWCGGPIVLIVGRGWIHKGGTLYMKACSDCPWQGPEQPGNECPSCGTPRLRDHHAAIPLAEENSDRLSLLRLVTAPSREVLLREHEETAYMEARPARGATVVDIAHSTRACRAAGISPDLIRDANRRGRARAFVEYNRWLERKVDLQERGAW